MIIIVKNKRNYLIIAVFVFIFCLRLYKITNPPLDYSSWRQCDTDSIARNFVEYKFNILYPQLNYDGPMPNYVQLEFQTTTFIIAVLYKLFGYSAVIGRIVPIAFFMGSCYFLYQCVKRRSGINTAILSVFFYGILPINIVFSRNIMPESALMFFTLGAIYYFLSWIDDGKLTQYILSAIFSMMAVATKIPAILICLPMIYLSVKKYKKKIIKNPYIIIFPVLVLALPCIYFQWLGTVSEQSYVNGIGNNIILPNFLTSIFKPDNLLYLSSQFSDKIFTIPGIILFFLGLVIKKNKEEHYYYIWLLAACLHCAFIDAVIHLDYYLLFITPVISIFMGIAARRILSRKRYRYFFYLAVSAVLVTDVIFVNNAYMVQENYITVGYHVMSRTSKDDLIIIGKDSPELLYTSGRKGWRLYNGILNEGSIEKLAGEGAQYFVPAIQGLDKDLKYYLDRNYERIDFPDEYYFYKLVKH